MNLFLIVVSLIFSICSSQQDKNWSTYKLNQRKSYNSATEEKKRFQTYEENLKEVEEHNKKYSKGQSTWYMGTNQYSDLTPDEFKRRILPKITPPPANKSQMDNSLYFAARLPDSFDWKSRSGVVLTVKNQGQCGSCWAFSATGALEGLNSIKHNMKVTLSEQELMDCSSGSFGCKGGWPTKSFEYVQSTGIQADSTYGYEAKVGQCRRSNGKSVLKVSGWRQLEQNEDALKHAIVTYGPVSVLLNAELLQQYKGGIVNDEKKCPNDGNNLNHAVVAVGYGSENGIDYWILKNSWGSGWGENGFVRMRRNPTICGLLLSATYPVA